MALAQPEQDGLLPRRTAPHRGSPATTTCMETLQVGRLHAVAAARDVLPGLAVPSDGIRWWRDVPTGPVGVSPWTVEERLRTAARQPLLARALAVRGRAGYYGARHRGPAASLGDVLVGAVPGGRQLTAFVPVAIGRPLAVRLRQALYAAREAIGHQRATGSPDAFDGAVGAASAMSSRKPSWPW